MWVDEQGVTHYTLDRNEIPEHLRDEIRDAEPAPEPVEAPAAAAPLARPEREPALEPAPEAAPQQDRPWVEAPAPEPGAEPAPLPPVETGVAPGDNPEVVRVKEQIAADRERIKQILAEPGADGAKLAASAELRETGARLARKQAELEGLRRESNP